MLNRYLQMISDELSWLLPLVPDEAIPAQQLVDLLHSKFPQSKKSMLRSAVNFLARNATSIVAKVEGKRAYYLR